MMSDLISVIVLVYNLENYIVRTLDSILSQTYKNIEVIVVDDGSPDRCPQMCDDYAEKDSRIKVVHKKTVDFPMPEMQEWLLQQASISALLTAMIMCLMTFLNVCWML